MLFHDSAPVAHPHWEQPAKVVFPVVSSGHDNPFLHDIILDASYICSHIEICCEEKVFRARLEAVHSSIQPESVRRTLTEQILHLPPLLSADLHTAVRVRVPHDLQHIAQRQC